MPRWFRCWPNSSHARTRPSNPTPRRVFSASSTSLKNDSLPLPRRWQLMVRRASGTNAWLYSYSDLAPVITWTVEHARASGLLATNRMPRRMASARSESGSAREPAPLVRDDERPQPGWDGWLRCGLDRLGAGSSSTRGGRRTTGPLHARRPAGPPGGRHCEQRLGKGPARRPAPERPPDRHQTPRNLHGILGRRVRRHLVMPFTGGLICRRRPRPGRESLPVASAGTA